MKHLTFILVLSFVASSKNAMAQKNELVAKNLEAHQVFLSIEKLDNVNVVKVIKDSAVKKANEPTFVKIKNNTFRNGTIEVKVLSRLLNDVSGGARGFIGIAFRIDDKNSQYESIYIALQMEGPTTRCVVTIASSIMHTPISNLTG